MREKIATVLPEAAGFGARLQLSIRRTHVHVSGKHLQKYVKEFEYRSNRRKRPGRFFSIRWTCRGNPDRGKSPRSFTPTQAHMTGKRPGEPVSVFSVERNGRKSMSVEYLSCLPRVRHAVADATRSS